MPCTLANSDTWDIHVLGKTLLFSTFLLSNFQGSLSLIILPFIWRNCVLNSSCGDGQKEDGSQSKGNVHGQGNSQLPKLSYKYFRVQYSTVLIVEQTPSRRGNRIGIGRHVCNSMLRPKNHNYFIWPTHEMGLHLKSRCLLPMAIFRSTTNANLVPWK